MGAALAKARLDWTMPFWTVARGAKAAADPTSMEIAMVEENFIVCCVWKLSVERLLTRKVLDFVNKLEVALVRSMLRLKKKLIFFFVSRSDK